MARPTKQGIDYFPMDVDLDQDDKLGMIIGEFGDKGERLWIKLLSWIYKNNGYYTEWGEDVQLKFLRRYNYCGFSMGFIKEVVPRFIKWELLDQVVFNTFHVLTSVRIQKTWLDATRKRKDREVDVNIWLLGVIDGLTAEETTKKAEEITQSKVKKSKEKKKRVNTRTQKKRIGLKAKEKTNAPPPVAPPPSQVCGLFPAEKDLSMDIPEMKVGVQIERVRYTRRVDIDVGQVLGMWDVFKREHFNGKKYYKDQDDIYSHFGNWLKGQNFSNGQQSTPKGNTGNHGQSTGAIKLARSLAADCGYPAAGGIKDPEP